MLAYLAFQRHNKYTERVGHCSQQCPFFNQTVTLGGINYGGTTMSLIKTRPGIAILLKHRLINLRFGELAALILLYVSAKYFSVII